MPELQYPDRVNCVTEFVDKWVTSGQGDRIAIISPNETLTYAQLAERINRIANVLTRDLGMVPGNRVLLRAANNPTMIAAYLAVMKAGGVTVATMPLLRAKELSYTVQEGEDRASRFATRGLPTRWRRPRRWRPTWSMSSIGADGELEKLMAKPGYENFTACDTAIDDVCLIAFTSGTTGEPKGTMHFHRDMLAPCDSYGKYVLQASPDDRFIGSAPLAFTFGLGGHVLFPFRIGAATIQLEKAPPEELLPAIEKYKATVCFTAPTAYRAIIPHLCEAQHRVAAQMRIGRRDAAEDHLRCLAKGNRHEDPRWHRRHRDDAHLSSVRRKTRCAAARPARRCRAMSPRSWTTMATRCRAAPSAGSRCKGPDRLPLSRRSAPDQICAEGLEFPRRHLCARMPTAISCIRRAPTT